LKTVLILFLSLVLFSLSILSCFWIGERFFFDKIFYQKSALHGYLPNSVVGTSSDEELTFFEKFLQQQRRTDLKQILMAETNNTVITGTKQDRPFTIVIIGDSFVYGTGVRTSERFGAVLERELNKLKPTQVYVLAEPGNSIVDDFLLYRLAQKHYHPDLTIIGLFENDLLFNSDRYPGAEELHHEMDLACPQPLFSIKTEDDVAWPQLIRFFHLSFSSAYKNYCFLQYLSERFGQDRKLLFFAFNLFDGAPQCGIYDTAEQCYDRSLMQKYAATLRIAGNTIYGQNQDVSFISESVSKMEDHPSKKMHLFYGQLLADYVKTHFW
jgi:hypothetical protein